MPDTVPCPNCRQPATWSEANPYRPFCSKRCKLIDLGDWVEQRHGIPGDPDLDAAELDDSHGEDDGRD